METAAVTDTGRVRDHNEDRHLLDARLALFIVADGMGGHQAGEVASQIAVETIHRSLKASARTRPPGDVLSEALLAAHGAIRAATGESVSRLGMGTTAVAAWLPPPGSRLWVAHVGDSRAYLLRGSALQRLTEDHTLLNQFARAGMLPADPAEWPARHALSQALGSSDLVAPGVNQFPLQTGDMILLCSDGLTDMLEDDDIARLLAAPESPQAICKALVREANQRGGRDNITVIVIRAPQLAAGVATKTFKLPPEEM